MSTLPQRIRAGYDSISAQYSVIRRLLATAHSRGLRREPGAASPEERLPCHSAFARVTTETIRPRQRAPASLPQRIRAGYDYRHYRKRRHFAPCHSAFARVTTAEKQCSALRICCEKVDSFSSVGESGLALTIFPFSFAAKATYVAINDSFGRAIDRFFWCEPHRN